MSPRRSHHYIRTHHPVWGVLTRTVWREAPHAERRRQKRQEGCLDIPRRDVCPTKNDERHLSRRRNKWAQRQRMLNHSFCGDAHCYGQKAHR